MASIGGAASGAMTGAKIGSIIPGVGTLLGGAVGGLFGGLFGRKKRSKPKPPKIDPLQQRYDQALEGNLPGADTMKAWKDRTMAFNPQEAINTAAQGAFAETRPMLDRTIGDLRQGQAAMGRLRSGFATEDEDRIVTDTMTNLNAKIAQNAVAGAGMEQRNNAALGDVAGAESGQYLDLLTGAMDRRTDRQNAEDARKAGRTNATMGAVGQIGGTLAAKVPWGKVGGWLSDIF